MNRVALGLKHTLALEAIDAAENRRMLRWGLFFIVLAVVLRLVFWIYTQRYWEDALITCLHSENCARGLGLTHVRPGEPPLHGFTSPLSVLVPLIGDLIHVGFGMDFLKLMSLPAAALTVLYVLAFGIHPRIQLPPALTVLAMGYVALEHHQILWGMAGMETQLSILILLMSLYYTVAWKPIPLGITLGLCMLVRPDYGFWTLIVGGYALFKAPRQLLRIVPIALAVYLPWIVFTTWYYGSPVPNTIIAKGLGYPKFWETVDVTNLIAVKQYVSMVLTERLCVMLGPTFHGHGGGVHIFWNIGPGSPIANLMLFFALLGGIVVAWRRQWTWWPVLLFVGVYTLYYVFLVPFVSPWYRPPYIAVLLLLSLRGIQATGALFPSSAWRNRLWAIATASYLFLFASVLPLTFHTERQIQRDIENAVRKPAGLYLAQHMKEDEAVGCEPLGYIGYYSQGNVYDWPGLNSRTVVAWSKAHPEKRCLEEMLKGLRPEYLFLRDIEITNMFQNADWVKEAYHPVAVFQLAPEKAKKIRWLRQNIDQSFRIYKKNHPEDALPYDDTLWPPGI